jgi:hypothetical protein
MLHRRVSVIDDYDINFFKSGEKKDLTFSSGLPIAQVPVAYRGSVVVHKPIKN